jgi:hypothetical protein
MAKAKTIVAIWQCAESGRQSAPFEIKKEKVKDLTRMRYNPSLRKRTLHKAKVVKGAEK